MNAKTRRWFARGLEVLVGVYMVAGAAPKVWDINRFSVQMSAYKVIQDPQWLPLAALATIFAEVALGVALLLGLRLRGLTVWALEAMLLFFTVLIVYAWVFHGLEDCGCFPLIKMTPPVSIAKNVLLAIAGVYLWWALSRWPAQPTGESGPDLMAAAPSAAGWVGVLVKCALTGFVGAACVVYAALHIEHIQKVAAPVQPGETNTEKVDFSQFVFDTEQGPFDLGKGTFLAPILSMTCEECMGKVPELNTLANQPGMPPMVALCYEDQPGDLDNFKATTSPVFPLHPLGDRPLLYFNLRGKDPFRLSLVHNGTVVRNWDGHVPKHEEVLAALPQN